MTMEEKQSKQRLGMERWKDANYQYYLAQTQALASRPESLEHRRNMYKLKHANCKKFLEISDMTSKTDPYWHT